MLCRCREQSVCRLGDNQLETYIRGIRRAKHSRNPGLERASGIPQTGNCRPPAQPREEEVAHRSAIVGIGVGLHPGYGSAQRLYIKRGYIPDGRGVWYRNRLVEEGMQAMFDDNLVLHLTKNLRDTAQ